MGQKCGKLCSSLDLFGRQKLHAKIAKETSDLRMTKEEEAKSVELSTGSQAMVAYEACQKQWHAVQAKLASTQAQIKSVYNRYPKEKRNKITKSDQALLRQLAARSLAYKKTALNIMTQYNNASATFDAVDHMNFTKSMVTLQRDVLKSVSKHTTSGPAVDKLIDDVEDTTSMLDELKDAQEEISSSVNNLIGAGVLGDDGDLQDDAILAELDAAMAEFDQEDDESCLGELKTEVVDHSSLYPSVPAHPVNVHVNMPMLSAHSQGTMASPRTEMMMNTSQGRSAASSPTFSTNLLNTKTSQRKAEYEKLMAIEDM